MPESLEVWTVALDALPVPAERVVRTITTDERRHAARFRHHRDRRRWQVSRMALRELLGSRLNRDPRDVELRLGRNGKPELASRKERLFFNLAHSQGVCLVALSPNDPVGIDVECARRFDDMPLVAERVFSPAERAAFGTPGSPTYVRAFYTAWTRKEALIKATGEGLSAALQCLEVFPGTGCTSHAVDYDGTEVAGWKLIDLPVATGYRGALAIPASCVAEIAMRDFGGAAGPGASLPPALAFDGA